MDKSRGVKLNNALRPKWSRAHQIAIMQFLMAYGHATGCPGFTRVRPSSTCNGRRRLSRSSQDPYSMLVAQIPLWLSAGWFLLRLGAVHNCTVQLLLRMLDPESIFRYLVPFRVRVLHRFSDLQPLLAPPALNSGVFVLLSLYLSLSIYFIISSRRRFIVRWLFTD